MSARLLVEFDEKNRRIICHGHWNLVNFKKIHQQLKKIQLANKGNFILDGKNITGMDSSGAWLLRAQTQQWKKNHARIALENFPPESLHLFKMIQKSKVSLDEIPLVKRHNFLAGVGYFTLQSLVELKQFLAFIGFLSFQFLRGVLKPTHWRLKALIHVIDTTGFKALPIVGLLSFMIGVVICYQMGNQLRNYGANVFIVNLLGLSILREFGPLITAIMVAGRTGSAFTAELGIMKINQEIDALNTMGVTPAQLLLIPRMIGLTLAMPLLTMWANIFGILGGMLMASSMLDISAYDFLHRFQHEIPVRSLMIGLGKAPVFALIVASIGCFQGMQVQSNAESLGKLTTRSVVMGIFFIIVADALFSIIFSRLGL